MTGQPAVEVEGLTKTFGDFTAVDRVSFTVRRREVFGFLGPNGAGKTTTIKMLTGLLPPSSGRGRVAGYDIARQRGAVKHEIGYMSQLFSLYADLTVEENIDFFASLYSVPSQRRHRRKAWVLEMAGLGGERRRLTGQLPLGFKQRLALGCAVLHEPPILFLDEPTSGVDPITRRRFWELIYQLTDAGTTVFVSTHYMEEAEYCHRLALMNRGSLIALDTPQALRGAMRAPLFEVDTDAGARATEVLKDAPGVLQAGLFGRSVHAVLAEGGPGAGERLRALLAEHGIAARRVEAIEPSLEDVFISLVRAAGGAREE